jgi:Protein of unknown function (DUF998)
LLAGGVVAGPLFVTTFTVEGATRAGYDPVRHPISALALGSSGGWRQVANFVVAGSLYLGFARGLAETGDPRSRSRLGPVLIGAAGAGLLASGAFATDPTSGYPSEAAESTPTGFAHNLAGVPVLLGLPAAQLIYARRSRRAGDRQWAAYSTGSALAMFGAGALASAGFAQTPGLVRLGGLFQRTAVITGFGWLTALAVRSLVTRESSSRDSS